MQVSNPSELGSISSEWCEGLGQVEIWDKDGRLFEIVEKREN